MKSSSLLTKSKFLPGSNAFTLAEVLITLGVIGVVAALTIPTLMKNSEKQVTLAKLKKAISVISQAYKMSVDDLGEPDDSFNLGGPEYFKQYWSPYLRVLKYCNTSGDCGYTSDVPWKYPDGTSTGVAVIYNDYGRTVYTPDGFVYMVRVKAIGSNPVKSRLVVVDINGSSKPNTYGKDVFFLERNETNGTVQPLGYDKDDNYVNQNCTKSCCQLTSTCAEKIRRAGWQIMNDYPW